MNAKNLVVSTLVGTVIYFMLGGLFYGVVFPNIYPASDDQNMIFVGLGCLTFCLMLAYIFLKWANITDPMTGAKAGGLIGLLYGAGMNFFMYSNTSPNYQNILIDIIINAIMGAIAGAVIAFTVGKLK